MSDDQDTHDYSCICSQPKRKSTPKKKKDNIFGNDYRLEDIAVTVADQVLDSQDAVEEHASAEEITTEDSDKKTDPNFYRRILIVYRDRAGAIHVSCRGLLKNRKIVEARIEDRLMKYCRRPLRTPETSDPSQFTREETIVEPDPRHRKLMHAVNMVYGLQEKRIAIANQTCKQMAPAHLDDADKAFLAKISKYFMDLEKDGQKQLKRLLKGIPIYDTWLSGVRGVGPAMSAILCASIDVYEAHTPSALFKYMGLACDPATGRAEVRTKGQKASSDPWLKSKMIKVLADCLIKAKNPIYKPVYDNRKNRKRNQIVPVCMGCEGTGKRKIVEREAEVSIGEKKPRKDTVCWNCNGTGGPVAWGTSDKHREVDARRVMLKEFLFDLWTAWRKLEGLPVRVRYEEEYLGRVHHQKESVDGPAVARPRDLTPEQVEQAIIDSVVESELRSLNSED